MTVFGYAYRDKSYPFSEVAGVGIIEGSQSDNRDAMPVLVFKTGAPLPLNTHGTYRANGGDTQSNDQVKKICAVTGLKDAREYAKLWSFRESARSAFGAMDAARLRYVFTGGLPVAGSVSDGSRREKGSAKTPSLSRTHTTLSVIGRTEGIRDTRSSFHRPSG